jgi:membrane-associated phospholipid phosphatase
MNDPGRGVGVIDALAGVPDPLVVLFALLTQLGDAWFLFVLLALFYWLSSEEHVDVPRRTGALLLAFTIGALLLTVGLKHLFALPRPPGAATAAIPGWLPSALEPVYANTATGTGFGFPSGHALGSTVVYGGFAALLSVWDRARRWLVAGTVIGLISLSRIVLGVHYLVDVVVGVVVGLAFLAVAVRVADGDPGRAFGLASVLGVLALALTLAGGGVGASEAATGLGAALGGFVAWHAVDDTLPATKPLHAAAGLFFSGGAWIWTYFAELSLPVTLGANALAVAGIIGLPALIERYESD